MKLLEDLKCINCGSLKSQCLQAHKDGYRGGCCPECKHIVINI